MKWLIGKTALHELSAFCKRLASLFFFLITETNVIFTTDTPWLTLIVAMFPLGMLLFCCRIRATENVSCTKYWLQVTGHCLCAVDSYFFVLKNPYIEQLKFCEPWLSYGIVLYDWILLLGSNY